MADTSTAPSTPAAQAAANRLAGMRPPAAAAAPVAEAALPDKKGKGKKGNGEEGEKKKKPIKPIKPIMIVVLVLLVGYVVKGKVVKPHYGPDSKVPAGAIYDFPASVTTNLPDGSLAQIGISLQTTAVASSKTITKDNSEFMGTAVKIIGAESYGTLLSPVGRVRLQQQLLQAFQTELGTSEGAQQVSAVYFTSYVLQQQ